MPCKRKWRGSQKVEALLGAKEKRGDGRGDGVLSQRYSAWSVFKGKQISSNAILFVAGRRAVLLNYCELPHWLRVFAIRLGCLFPSSHGGFSANP